MRETLTTLRDRHGNATTAAALLTLFEELDAASIDVQMFVGDVLDKGCPGPTDCGILNCTKAAVNFAKQLRNRSDDSQGLQERPSQLASLPRR